MTARTLANRAIIRLVPLEDGEDVRGFLQGLVTNDVSGDLPVYAALLSAQGKAMFDFFVWAGDNGALRLDCEAEVADDLAKRLSLYRLRRKIDIARDETLGVFWSIEAFDGGTPDPRLSELGFRAVAATNDANAADATYLAHRLNLGVPEGRGELGDILWLETNAVELNGVSFEKGCYIGQENTARMNWRQKVNRRLVVVPIDRSEDKRRKAVYPELELAVDHLRVADLDPAALPDWQATGIAD
ncbi:folate-binding protein [Erythrobacter sp. F6033]|uniref:CAF17-like 4Fe-4S cluster assembly/insertion protein YgfZ n=1 Tax=Erythrobacter sp. F6033 TaxID=2926401 RepID=UPI001FF6E35B|nr:folate-binding protein [Erythrobacter sp. F6033]MCK0128795.1 folate-binding protein [Erythrobacter sp. F6033]